jgi:protoheme ferro-lyase
MTDHMETLYDLDIVAAEKVLQSDLEFARAPVPNQDPQLVEDIATMVGTLI